MKFIAAPPPGDGEDFQHVDAIFEPLGTHGTFDRYTALGRDGTFVC
jgi:hypothetical protein